MIQVQQAPDRTLNTPTQPDYAANAPVDLYNQAEVDTITGLRSDLTTATKANLVAAINELLALLGDISTLNHSSADAVTEINLVDAEIHAEITRATSVEGALSSLTTTTKANLVAAINELDQRKADDDTVVHLAGAETITGAKNFTNTNNRAPTQTPLTGENTDGTEKRISSVEYVDDAVAAAILQTNEWLPSVATYADLPTVTDNTRNWLCRVITGPAYPATGAVGVYQHIAGSGTWTYFSDNTDFVDDAELETRLETLVPAVTSPEGNVWVPNPSGDAGDPLVATGLAALVTEIITGGGATADALADALVDAIAKVLTTQQLPSGADADYALTGTSNAILDAGITDAGIIYHFITPTGTGAAAYDADLATCIAYSTAHPTILTCMNAKDEY